MPDGRYANSYLRRTFLSLPLSSWPASSRRREEDANENLSVTGDRGHSARIELDACACGFAGGKRQDLPHGTAMPLGKFQKDLCLREGVPLMGSPKLH